MKIAGYALNACAFAFGAWIASTALESEAASATDAPPTAGGDPADSTIAAPTTVDYGPHLEPR